MQTPKYNLASFANGVAKLEVHNRRLKKAGIVTFIAGTLVAVIAMGQAHAPAKEILKANEFVLRDASEKVGTQLSIETKDKPMVTLLHGQTTPAGSGAGRGGPQLLLAGAGTPGKVQLGANKVSVRLDICEEKIRASLSLQKGFPVLAPFYDNGNPRVTFTASSSDSEVTLFETGKSISFAMGLPPSGEIFQVNASGNKHTVKLTWKASGSNVAGYNVYRSTRPGGNYVRINSSLVRELWYIDDAVESGKTYYYATRSVDAQGYESGNSNECSVVIP